MIEIVEWCQSGADVNKPNEQGLTALMASSRNGDLKIVKLLIRYGAHINLKDHRDLSALQYATFENNLEIVEYLVSNGADISNGVYMTAIHKNHKEITAFFDSLDKSKQVFNTTKEYNANKI